MKGLSILDMQKALGKLILRREEMIRRDSGANTDKIDGFINQLKIKIKNV